ncbi:SpoIIE family protein phosphatase [Fluviicola taffensis]|uniref:Protein serine/threonine phosphatase n=1 Tax=Fluviicola taffensis (strain DSM 16823 / NCIMB 13979 / RW262) TaxID=755732 RepID=F2I998_FLUTR|nr:SpoIIE family protein phosphatase [Fluviicola taffensis]AEA44055.1 protein serine/threonine phosphatase [Fluviicola taffensis DSM 16823]
MKILSRLSLITILSFLTFSGISQESYMTKVNKKEFPQKIAKATGDQKLVYEYFYTLFLKKEPTPKLYDAYLSKLKKKTDRNHQEIVQLIESAALSPEERLAFAVKFVEKNKDVKVLSVLGKHFLANSYDLLDDEAKVIQTYERELHNFKKYPGIRLKNVYLTLGTSNYYLGNTDKCLYYFNKSVEATDKRDTASLAGLLMNVGVINYRTGNNAAAISAYKRADKINGSIDLQLKGMILENLALSYTNYGRTDLSMKYYDDAGEIYLKLKDTLKYNALIQNKVGDYIKLNDFESAIKSLKTSMAFFKKTNNKTLLPSAHAKMADIYLQLKDTSHAITEINKAIGLSRNNNTFTYVTSVFAKSSMVAGQEGLNILLNLEKELIQKKYDGENATLYNKIGVRYKIMNQLVPAEKYFRKAIEAELTHTPPKPEVMVGNNQNLGVVYYDRKEYALALKAYQEADKYQDIKNITGQHLADRFELYANVYGKLGQYKLAYENLSNYKRVQDSINSLSLNDKILSLKQEFQTQQIEDSLSINKKELNLSNLKIISEKATNQRNTFIIFGMLIVLVLIFGLVILIARSNKQRKVANLALTEKNEEIKLQQMIVQQKNDEIIDSINYAKRLQNTILPPQAEIDDLFPKNFVLYKPKDIVAGDFYVCENIEMAGRKIGIVAVADCTGHGVPGALVSMVCSSAIKRSVVEFNLTDPGKILDKSAQLVVQSFQSAHEKVKDGMDISLACIDFNSKTMQWAGANNPFWMIRNNELIEIKADKQPVGLSDNKKDFTTHTIQLETGDKLYFISDGYADQFGGVSGKKLKTKNLKDMLIETNQLSISEQGKKLENYFAEWKADFEQVDDVCIMGIEIV